MRVFLEERRQRFRARDKSRWVGDGLSVYLRDPTFQQLARGRPVCWCWPGRVRGEGWTCSGIQRVSG